jgi:hypothetical protein
VLAQIEHEMATNADYEAQFRELIPGLRDRMTAILDRFSDPADAVEDDIVMLARRELAFLASELFKIETLKLYMH